jgi:hypothetical protein
MANNQHGLWLLVREGLCTTGTFWCPSDEENEYDETRSPNPRDWWNFERLTDCSYSYQNQLGRASNHSKMRADVVVLADKSPGRVDVYGVRAPEDEAALEDWYQWNSPNHEFEGQNVLRADGSVSFTTTPFCGRGNNNIWVKDMQGPTRAEHPQSNLSYEECRSAYHEIITHRDDTWLVP